MKKILCFLLSVLLVVTLVSCNSTSKTSNADQPKEPEETKPAPIELTTSNIGDYLSFYSVGGEITTRYQAMWNASSNLRISSYPIVPGKFYNVKVTLSCSLPSGWGDNERVTVSIPSNGCLDGYSLYIDVIDCYRQYGGGYVNMNFTGSRFSVRVLSVSGTFQPE